MNRSTRSAFVVAGVCFVGAMTLPLCLSPRSQPGDLSRPRIRVSPSHVDLGRVISDSQAPLQAEFLIENIGNDVLVISEIERFCSCEVLDLSHNELAPGEKTTLRARVRARSWASAASSALLVHSNDPVSPSTRLTFAWETVSRVFCEPGELTIRMGNGTEATATTQVRAYHLDRTPPQVRGIECWPPEIEATFRKATDVADTAGNTPVVVGYITLQLRPTALQEQGSGWVRLRTEDDSCAPCVPVKWMRDSGVLFAEPSFVFLGGIAPGLTARRTVAVRSQDGTKFKLERVHATSSIVRASILSDMRAAAHELEIEVTAPQQSGAFQESIVLESDLANDLPLFVKVAGVVRAD